MDRASRARLLADYHGMVKNFQRYFVCPVEYAGCGEPVSQEGQQVRQIIFEAQYSLGIRYKNSTVGGYVVLTTSSSTTIEALSDSTGRLVVNDVNLELVAIQCKVCCLIYLVYEEIYTRWH